MTSQRNTEILRAAAAEVAAVGLRRTSLTDVAKRAGVSRMTVYREYGDAPTLWRSLLTYEISAVVAEADRAAQESATSGRQRLVLAVVEGVRRLSTHPLVTRVLELDPELILPFVVDRLGSGQEIAAASLREMLRDGVADGSIGSCDEAATAHLLLLIAQSLVFSARLTPGDVSAERITEQLRRLLDQALRPDSQPKAPPTDRDRA